jgi:hypothetical protein
MTALVVGCGGGTDDAVRNFDSPQGTTGALRAADSSSGISAESAANQLLDAAEAAYPQYFTVHRASQWALPFLYRYYPQTGIYLAVVVEEGSPYQLNGIYAAGGPFGSLATPTYLGLVSQYIAPVPQAAQSFGNGCNDFSLEDTEGATAIVEVSGGDAYPDTSRTFTRTIRMSAGGLSMFEGHQAREHTTSTSTTSTRQTAAYGLVTSTTRSVSRGYRSRTGDAESTTYGYLLWTGTTTPTDNEYRTRSVFSPPYVEQMYSLAAGGSFTATWQEQATDRLTSETVVTDNVVYTKYVGRESLAVPAGTFEVCRFEDTYPGNAEKATYWRLVGSGLLIKSAIEGGGYSYWWDATSVTVNGKRL